MWVVQGLVIAVLLLVLPIHCFAACSVEKLAELSVRMSGVRPLVPVTLNGRPTALLIDSASDYTYLWHGSAAALKLKTRSLDNGFLAATVDDFVLDKLPPQHKVTVYVGGNDVIPEAMGVLGQNVLGVADTEYDLSNGIVRLLKPSHCGDAMFAYWAIAAKLPVEIVKINDGRRYSSKIVGTATLGGQTIRVVFDTAQAWSVISMAAAKRLGVTPESPNVAPSGVWMGYDQRLYHSWIAPFTSFKIGTEEIRNTRLRFGEYSLGDIDMILGIDFFLSHHIYVAQSQHKLYFTYNGGPVFNLASLPPVGTAEAPTSASRPQSQEPLAGGDDAPGFAARGRALLARQDFEGAIKDLTHACELDSTQPEFFLQRALAYSGAKQDDSALTDVTTALHLKPDYVDALHLRAQIELARKDMPGALADLDAMDRAAGTESYLRYSMSSLYLAAGGLQQSVRQLDLFIANHPNDEMLPDALNNRCWTRVLWNRDLDKAQDDCKRALRIAPDDPADLDTLGWLYLRLGRYRDSIRAFDTALHHDAKYASSIYGRGIDEIRLGNSAAGEADVAAANALHSSIEERMRNYGISP